MTRREFGLSLSGPLAALGLHGAQDGPWAGPATVKKIYLAAQRISWPRPDLDVAAERASLEAALGALERRHGEHVRFTGGDLVRSVEEAQAFVKSLGQADGVLIVDLTSGTEAILAPLRDLPVPMLLYSRPYSGWCYRMVARWMREGRRADLVSTTDPEDLVPYLRAFHSFHHLRNSKVLVVRTDSTPSHHEKEFAARFGTAFAYPPYADLKAAFDAADAGAARKAAEEFTRCALRVVEPSPQDIENSLRFFSCVGAVLEREKANAITIDCLGGFRRGDLPAYPCVAWSKLNDAGYYGVCEADPLSTITQMLLTPAVNKPGFISDPTFDTGRNEIIHAHCVAATLMEGFGGPRSPYAIRSHMEDNKGVSVQVMMPASGTVTVGKFLDAGTFVISTGEVLGNIDGPRGCRTKILTRVADARKMLEGFSGGLHRVVYYGDYVRQVERMGQLMGFKVVREM